MSIVHRWSQLGNLSGRLAVQAAVSKLRGSADESRDQRLAGARVLADRLSSLKGAAMKVGQQVAIVADQLDLPEDVQLALRKLHDQAEAVPFSEIEATLRDEFEVAPDRLFASIDRQPLGTASLAQAHAATLVDGREVVVKVQHAGVRASVDADLLAVRTLLATGRAFGRDRAELDDLFSEMRERLHEELDLLQEAVNLQQFGSIYDGDERYVMPRHHPALCTERVITLDRVHGVPLHEFARVADREAQQNAGVRLADLFLEMTFVHRLLHADPHPGNYLFGPDGTVGVIDFGCVKRFSPFWVGTYARLVRAALDRDDRAVLSAARDLDALRGDDPRAERVILDFCDAIVGPLRDNRMHTIGGVDDDVTERVRPIVERMWRYPQIRGPRNLLFLHRTLGGMYAMARTLRVEARWEERLRPHLNHAIATAEGRSP